MDFDLTEEQAAVRDLARRILGDRATHDRLSSLEAEAGPGGAYDAQLWSELGQAGLLGAGLPEAVGGSGLGALGLHVLLEEVGATVAPVPALESLVLGALPLSWAAVRLELVTEVVVGRAVLSGALVDEDSTDPAVPSTRATRDGAGWRLDGAKTLVPYGAQAAGIVVPGRAEDGTVVVALVLPDDEGMEVTAQAVLGQTPHARLELDGVTVPAERVLAADDGALLRRLLQHARAGWAAVQAGIVGAALRLTAEHAGRREQFGRPIATFQAVGQRLADAYIQVEALRLTAVQAAWRLSEGLRADEEVAIAAWWAAEAGHTVLHSAQHIHGGLGVDRDYPLHRYFERGVQVEAALGGAGRQLRDLGASLANTP